MFKFPIIVIFHFSIDLHVIKSDVGQISVSFIFTHVFSADVSKYIGLSVLTGLNRSGP